MCMVQCISSDKIMDTQMFMTWNLLQIDTFESDLILLLENIIISVFNELNSIPHFSAKLLSVSVLPVRSKSI